MSFELVSILNFVPTFEQSPTTSQQLSPDLADMEGGMEDKSEARVARSNVEMVPPGQVRSISKIQRAIAVAIVLGISYQSIPFTPFFQLYPAKISELLDYLLHAHVFIGTLSLLEHVVSGVQSPRSLEVFNYVAGGTLLATIPMTESWGKQASIWAVFSGCWGLGWWIMTPGKRWEAGKGVCLVLAMHWLSKVLTTAA
ncbi:uncharacterized protein BP5553_01715 [Venustampulla echinocandica]|uniref:Uncharacterized protein n=1 Tax=Venustampulla echinocandica TaxID=2656787 RepID=A0A370U1T3_9HELO|nr:uncharacterized protein BP5553_01715 [Venustampulla echinocandica]RDL41736.1 hypothetical protein BP5553_01715 [Venustampulla echinocandica]